MSSDSIPKMMRAVVQNKDGNGASVQEIPVPQLEANDILVKVEYSAQNPTDWKASAFRAPPGAIIGCDFSGTVVKLGDNLKNADIKLGDKVAGTVHGGLSTTKGSNAQYLRAESDLVFKVPEGVQMEQAATFGVAWVTACQVLISSQKKPFPPERASTGEWYLVYGASSSVGLFSVPLAKAMGYKVIGVCSPHSFDLVKSYGADEVISYRDGVKAGEEIKRISGGGITLAIDTISEGESYKIALSSFKEGVEGQLNMILFPPEEAHKLRPDVKLIVTIMYTLFGHEFNMAPKTDKPQNFPQVPGDREFMVELCKRTPDLITKLGIKSNPVTVRGSLDDVLAGWEDMKNGKVSGTKLVYKIA